ARHPQISRCFSRSPFQSCSWSLFDSSGTTLRALRRSGTSVLARFLGFRAHRPASRAEERENRSAGDSASNSRESRDHPRNRPPLRRRRRIKAQDIARQYCISRDSPLFGIIDDTISATQYLLPLLRAIGHGTCSA